MNIKIVAGKTREKVFEAIFFAAAAFSIVAVLLICLFLFVNGIPAMKKIGVPDFIFGLKWKPGSDLYGIFPMIVGSLYVTFGAVIFGAPIGLMTAVFLAKFCPEKLYKILKPSIEILAGIPSVVYGFFGLMVIVPFMRNVFGGNGSCIFTASLLLGMMILPTIISVSESSLRAVPESYYDGARALGATHERAVGETMAVIMVAGNQARIPDSVLKGVRTLTANIVLEMGYATGLHREALIATGVVLFVFILLINLTFNIVSRLSGKAH